MKRGEPTFYVLLEPLGGAKGSEERVDLTDRVTSFEYHEEEDKSDMLRLSVRNWDLSAFDEPTWHPGNSLLVAWGYVGNMSAQRRVKITKVSGFTELTVEAQGAEADLNRIVRSRVFEKMTRTQVVAQIAIEHGFDPDQLDIEDIDEAEDIITQANLTDAQMLRRLAQIEGFEFFADVDGLHFHRRRLGQAPIRTFVWYSVPFDVKDGEAIENRGDIISINVDSDIFSAPKAKSGRVVMRSRDPKTKTDVAVAASDSETERDVVAPRPIIIDPRTAAWRYEQGSPEASAPKEDVRPTTQPSQAAAKREADGAFRKGQQTAVEMSMSIVGDPRMVAKSVVEVRNISARLSGKYYVRSCAHKIGSGYVTEMKLISDGFQKSAGGGVNAADLSRQLAQARAAVAALAANQAATEQDLSVAIAQGNQKIASLEKRLGRAQAAESKATPNEREPVDGQKDLVPVVTIDPRTFAVRTTYVDAGGRNS